jgi:hypothetical protein
MLSRPRKLMRKRIIALILSALFPLLAAEAKSFSQSIGIDLATIDKQVQSQGICVWGALPWMPPPASTSSVLIISG